MIEPALAFTTSSRKQRVVTIVVCGLVFLLGSQLVDPHVTRRVFAGAVLVTSLIAGIIPALGTGHPRLSRWLLLTSFASLAVSLGLLTRIIVQGFQHLG